MYFTFMYGLELLVVPADQSCVHVKGHTQVSIYFVTTLAIANYMPPGTLYAGWLANFTSHDVQLPILISSYIARA